MASDADRLAKRIYPHLIQAGFNHRALDECGWFSWVEGARPNTTSAVTMACHLILFLSAKGKLGHMRMQCVKALIMFLQVERGQFPTVAELKALKALLDATPVNDQHVSEWFHRNYP